MFQTQNDLPEVTRRNITDLLQTRLAEAIDLVLQTKQAHWNVKGPHFIALHELFDKVHEEVESSVDLIAERIMQLGGTAGGTLQAVAKYSSLPEFPMTLTEDFEYIRFLSRALGAFGKSVRQGIDQAAKSNDAITADILTEVCRAADKNLWFVESHLAGGKAGAKPVKGVA